MIEVQPHQVCINVSTDPRVRVCVDTILEEIRANIARQRCVLLEYLIAPPDLARVVSVIEAAFPRCTVPLCVTL